jgi:hypothetical protein
LKIIEMKIQNAKKATPKEAKAIVERRKKLLRN